VLEFGWPAPAAEGFLVGRELVRSGVGVVRGGNGQVDQGRSADRGPRAGLTDGSRVGGNRVGGNRVGGNRVGGSRVGGNRDGARVQARPCGNALPRKGSGVRDGTVDTGAPGVVRADPFRLNGLGRNGRCGGRPGVGAATVGRALRNQFPPGLSQIDLPG
jgi:hypothetical protein